MFLLIWSLCGGISFAVIGGACALDGDFGIVGTIIIVIFFIVAVFPLAVTIFPWILVVVLQQEKYDN